MVTVAVRGNNHKPYPSNLRPLFASSTAVAKETVQSQSKDLGALDREAASVLVRGLGLKV